MLTRILHQLASFYHNERGAYSVSFALMTGLFFAVTTLSLDTTRFLSAQAKLSDAMEQATLALTAADNHATKSVQTALVKDYIQTYLPKIKSNKINILEIKRDSGINPISSLYFTRYQALANIEDKPLLYTTLFPSFTASQTIGNSATAIKYRSVMNVMFVIDVTGSMAGSFGIGTRLDVLKQITIDITKRLLELNTENQIAVIPYTQAVKVNSQCIYPFTTISRDPVIPPLNENNPFDIDHVKNNLVRLYRVLDVATTIDALPNYKNGMLWAGSCPESYLDFTNKEKSIVNYINNTKARGGTLTTSGVIVGTNLFDKKIKQLLLSKNAENSTIKNVFVIVSDGEDSSAGKHISFTDQLIRRGLCTKIHQIFNQDNVEFRMAFVRIANSPMEITSAKSWQNCVGAENYYTANNSDKLRDSLSKAVFEEVGRNLVRP